MCGYINVCGLQNGDSNTKYLLNLHRPGKKNLIKQLQDDQGMWYTWESGLGDHICDYFKDLFISRGCSGDSIFDKVQSKVSGEQNENLIRPFCAEEVKAAIFSMHPDKSPRLDGINSGFYQSFWDVVGHYLGLPSLVGILKKYVFSFIEAKIKQQLGG